MIKKSPFFASLFFLLGFSLTQAQIKVSDWKINKMTPLEKNSSMFKSLPQQYMVADITIGVFEQKLKSTAQEITLPSPDGTFVKYEIRPSKVVADEVAHLYTVKTFIGYQKDNPSVIMACNISNQGFHAAIYDGGQTYFIEPIELANAKHLVYFKKDLPTSKINCLVEHVSSKILEETIYRAPSAKRTYNLAIIAMAGYSSQFGGSPYSDTNVLNAMAAGVNLMAPVWIRDLGIEFNLVSTAALVSTNSNEWDPDSNSFFTDVNNACINAVGVNGFDVGHIVNWGGAGGFANFEVICDNSSKGHGYSGANGSLNQLWVDYVAHEIGHQFGSEHNFVAECGGNSANSHRYEPGEGSTIMCYAGVCQAADSYQNFSDPYFHYNSIQQINTFLNTTSCAVTSGGNSSDPTVNAGGNITIPKQTPFIVVGSGSDANDPASALTYDWVQYDGNSGVDSGNPNCNSTSAPMFRYRPPVSENYRALPQYSNVLAGNNNGVTWEKLPCTARNMTFSLTVRDNNTNFGRLTEDRMNITVANTGPFNVITPNGGESLPSSSTITWSVNGTNAHCSNVDILLSTDGGTTYTILVDGTTNDGSETVTFPSSSTTARILVRCDVAGGFRSASTFYDVSDGNFEITGGTATCSDGIQNQGETGIDCGGPCPACVPTCSDGIQNQGETGIDCGSPCPACQTCDMHTLTLVTDEYPEETSWEITDSNGGVIASGGNYTMINTTETAMFCLDIGECYDFTIYDDADDGLCCTYGQGSYSISSSNGTIVASGGQFNASETTQICPTNGGGGDCFTDLTNSNGLGTNETGIKDYESSSYIRTTATTVIQNGAKVDYDATTDIELNANFEVKLGAEFNAFIDGCNNGAGGINVKSEDDSNQ